MGLLMTIYEFEVPLPSLEQIEGKLTELAGHDLIKEGSLTFSESDRARKAHITKSATHTPLSSAKVCFRNPKRHRRPHGSVDLHVSLCQTEIFVASNDSRLFYAACKALKSLGGIQYQAPKQRNAAAGKR